MCGIAGLIGPDPDNIRTALNRMSRAMRHRGPDGEGTELRAFGRAWLGIAHRRLSILDLTTAGQQPMSHAATGATIVFNGEIYNYRKLRAELERDGEVFHSNSDTEVLLAGLTRYGRAYLGRLEGMYAFAFHDPRCGSVLLARDPAGIKPLYLAENGHTLLFASETRTLLAAGLSRKVDRRGMAGFLAYGAVQHPLTLFDGIVSVEPGSSLTVSLDDDGELKKPKTAEAFWQFADRNSETTAKQSLSDVCSTIRGTLSDAVKDHLVADVPVGLFLSSGLDSTILAGLAAKHTSDLKSFTVVFTDQPDFSEEGLAAQTATLFGLQHTEIPLPMTAAEGAVEDWFGALDQPSIDGLNQFVISRAVRERGIKVALTGLGADELFGGYPSFRDVPRLQRLTRLTRRLPVRLRRTVGHWTEKVLSAEWKVLSGRHHSPLTTHHSPRNWSKLSDICASAGSLRSLYLHRRRLMSDRQLAALGLKAADLDLDEDFLDPAAITDVEENETDPVQTISQLESRCYQGNMLLRDADTNGMAVGLEIRVPYLARPMLNLAHSLPGEVRLPAGAPGKQLLRTTFSDLLRPEILNQPKRGFTLPISRWMAGSLRPRCEQSLTVLKDNRLLNPNAVDAVWHSFLQKPDSPIWTRAFALVVLGEMA